MNSIQRSRMAKSWELFRVMAEIYVDHGYCEHRRGSSQLDSACMQLISQYLQQIELVQNLVSSGFPMRGNKSYPGCVEQLRIPSCWAGTHQASQSNISTTLSDAGHKN